MCDFEPWLNDKLKSLKTDEGVFGSYISGILESEDSIDDKRDALEGLLSEFVVSHGAPTYRGLFRLIQ